MLIKLDEKRYLNLVQSGEGQSIVLLHGNAENHGIFQKLRSVLEKQFHVLAIDSPGHGKSYQPQELDYAMMAKDIAELIKLTTKNKPLIVGYSDGGIIALHIAIHEPSLAAGLVICGTNISLDGLDESSLEELQKIRESGRADAYTKLMLNQKAIAIDQLRTIKIPVLVTAGEHDVIKLSHSRIIAAAVPKSKLRIFEGEDHGSYVVQSTTLAPIITEFRKLIEVRENNYEVPYT